MASWTDSVPQFNPHIETLPVDAYINVGMAKQAQYERGLEQIKGVITQISGLPVAREIDRQYVQQALTSLQKGIKETGTPDFANNQLVSQVQGAASKIASDPIIQKSLSSAMRIKKGYTELEDAKKAGKSAPSNEWMYNSQVQGFMNSTDLNEEFNGSYDQYTDILDEFRKVYKETFPDEALLQSPVIKYNEDGSMISVLDEKTKKTISPDKVQHVWNLVKSRPGVMNQLHIDGQYKFKDYTPEQLYKYVTEDSKTKINQLNDNIKKIQLIASTDASSDAVALTNEMKGVRDQIAYAQKSYDSIVKGLNTNPDAVKSFLHEVDMSNNLIGAFSYSQTSEKILNSPIYDAWLKNKNYELDLAQFEETKRHNLATEANDTIKALKDKSKGDKDEDGLSDFTTITVPGNIKDDEGQMGSATFLNDLNAQKAQLNQGMYKGVYEIAQSNKEEINPIRLSRNGGYEFNVDPTGKTGYKTIDAARKTYHDIYSAAREAQMKGTPTLKVKQMFEKIDPLIDNIRTKEAKSAEIETSYKDALPKSVSDNKSFTLKGVAKGAVVNTQDMVDIWVYNNEPVKSDQRKQAYDRLSKKFEGKFGSNFFKYIEPNGIASPKEMDEYYKTLSSELKSNQGVTSTFQERENKYKDAQTAYQYKNIGIIAGKAEQKEQLRSIYSNIANAIAEGNNSSEAKKIAKLTVNSDKESQDNLYGVKNRNGRYFLTVTRGKDVAELEVTQAEINQIPGVADRNQFVSKFGDRMEMTRFTTTDIPINGKQSGEYTAYTAPKLPNSKYNVRYHITGDGTNFDFEIYVRDAQGNLLIGPYALGLNTSMEGIVQSEKELANDVLIEALINKNK